MYKLLLIIIYICTKMELQIPFMKRFETVLKICCLYIHTKFCIGISRTYIFVVYYKYSVFKLSLFVQSISN